MAWDMQDIKQEITDIGELLRVRIDVGGTSAEKVTALEKSMCHGIKHKISSLPSLTAGNSLELVNTLNATQFSQAAKDDLQELIDEKLASSLTSGTDHKPIGRPQKLEEPWNYMTPGDWAVLDNEKVAYWKKVQTVCERFRKLGIHHLAETTVKWALSMLVAIMSSHAHKLPEYQVLHSMVKDFKDTFQSTPIADVRGLLDYPKKASDLPNLIYKSCYKDDGAPEPRHIERVIQVSRHLPLRCTSKLLASKQPSSSGSNETSEALVIRMLTALQGRGALGNHAVGLGPADGGDGVRSRSRSRVQLEDDSAGVYEPDAADSLAAAASAFKPKAKTPAVSNGPLALPAPEITPSHSPLANVRKPLLARPPSGSAPASPAASDVAETSAIVPVAEPPKDLQTDSVSKQGDGTQEPAPRMSSESYERQAYLALCGGAKKHRKLKTVPAKPVIKRPAVSKTANSKPAAAKAANSKPAAAKTKTDSKPAAAKTKTDSPPRTPLKYGWETFVQHRACGKATDTYYNHENFTTKLPSKPRVKDFCKTHGLKSPF